MTNDDAIKEYQQSDLVRMNAQVRFGKSSSDALASHVEGLAYDLADPRTCDVARYIARVRCRCLSSRSSGVSGSAE
jgi:hypothetical protein